MSALPRLYAKFRPLFAQMDLPLRSALEGMLTSFAMLPAPTTADERQITGEFVGFDGIENRGRLSNLLESEWLLRELDPDDFVRRVTEGEVMFRRREFKGTGTKDVLGVVLDCGPWMLGSNRITALASLFYLSLRAQQIGARLLWTVPGIAKGWSEDLTPENIRIFLGRIVQGSLGHSTIDELLDHFESGPKECWYVGAAQSKDLAQHPDITSSIIVQPRYGADEVEVHVNSRGRNSKLSIVPASDADIVAALRRPFLPERKKVAKIADDRGDLTAKPFLKDWLLDRFNHAVLVNYVNGVLWYPFRDGATPIWLTVPHGKAIFGVQPQSDGQISLLVGRDETALDLVTVNLSQTSARSVTRKAGYLDTNIGPQPKTAMGNLHVALAEECQLVAQDGTLQIVVLDKLSKPRETGDRVVFTDGIYLIEQTNGALRVRNPRRGTLARHPLPDDHHDLFKTPRRVTFAPDTKAITFTTDGVLHTALIGTDIIRFELEGMVLLHLHSTSNVLAWDASENSLVRFKLVDSQIRDQKRTRIETPITGLPRYCPLTQTIFALNAWERDGAHWFVPLETKRGWQNVEAFDVPAAIDMAETLWL